MSEVTQVLGLMQEGDAKAAKDLLPLVYQELRRLAAYARAWLFQEMTESKGR